MYNSTKTEISVVTTIVGGLCLIVSLFIYFFSGGEKSSISYNSLSKEDKELVKQEAVASFDALMTAYLSGGKETIDRSTRALDSYLEDLKNESMLALSLEPYETETIIKTQNPAWIVLGAAAGLFFIIAIVMGYAASDMYQARLELIQLRKEEVLALDKAERKKYEEFKKFVEKSSELEDLFANR